MDRYEEAVERAKKGLPIDEVFPELKESEDEKIRKELLKEIEFITPRDGETDGEGLILPSYHARIDRYKSYLEKQKPAECHKDTLLKWVKLVLKCQEEELAKYDGPSYGKAFTMGRIDAYKVLIAKLNSL